MLFADQNSESVAKVMSAGITETFSIDQMEQLTSYLRRFGDFKKKLQGTVLLVEDSISQQRLTRAVFV